VSEPGWADFSGADRVLAELDLEADLSVFRHDLGEDWAFVIDYVSMEIRATLELGTMIRSLLDVAEARGHVSPDVSNSFRSNQTIRSRNFGVSDGRDTRFMELALSDRGDGLIGALERARQAAESRMFEDGGLRIVTPPPVGKRQALDIM
jgi:hypothetical protein